MDTPVPLATIQKSSLRLATEAQRGDWPQFLSSRRRILPTFVFGSSVRNSICLGRL